MGWRAPRGRSGTRGKSVDTQVQGAGHRGAGTGDASGSSLVGARRLPHVAALERVLHLVLRCFKILGKRVNAPRAEGFQHRSGSRLGCPATRPRRGPCRGSHRAGLPLAPAPAWGFLASVSALQNQRECGCRQHPGICWEGDSETWAWRRFCTPDVCSLTGLSPGGRAQGVGSLGVTLAHRWPPSRGDLTGPSLGVRVSPCLCESEFPLSIILGHRSDGVRLRT